MTTLALYDVNTLGLVHDLSSFIVTQDITYGLNGNAEGEITLEYWNEQGDYLPIEMKNIYSNSHYVKVGTEKLYPCVVKGVTTNAENSSLFTIHLKSYYSYTEEIEMIPFYRAKVDSLTLAEDDESSVFNVYGSNYLAVLRNVLYNNQMVMEQRNAPTGLINYTALDYFTWDITNNFASQSYRINGLELQSLSVAIDDLLGDAQQLINVTTTQNISDDFAFVYELVFESVYHEVSLGDSTLFSNITYDNLSRETYRDVALSGDDLLGRKRLERRSTGENSAYSALLGEKPSEKTDTLSQEVDALRRRATSINGSVSFTTMWADLNVLDFVTIEDYDSVLPPIGNPLIHGVIVNKNHSGNEFTYTIQISPVINEMAQIHMGSNDLQRVLFSTMKNIKDLTLRNSKSSNSKLVTGWKQ